MKKKYTFIKITINKYLFILFLFFSTINCKAQITLEHTFDSSLVGVNFYITDLGNNNSKYVLIDTATNSFSLYNLDKTPFLLNILTPEPILPDFSIAYITSTLFDCDSTNIEYAFISYLNQYQPFRILRTDGTILLQVDSVLAPVCYGCIAGTKEIVPIVNTQDGAKLLLFKTNNNLVSTTFVYRLCGTLPITNSIIDFSSTTQYVKVYPNPASLKINFDITLPSNLIDYEFIVYNSNSQEIKKEFISGLNLNVTLDLANYANGEYYYKLISNNKLFQSGKFILTK